MFRWAPFPFVRISIVAIAGILFYDWVPLEQTWIFSLAVFFLFIYATLFILIKNRKHLHYRHFFGLIGLISLFFLFQLRSNIANPVNQDNHLINQATECDYFYGKVTAKGEPTEKTIRYQFTVQQIRDSSRWKKSKGKIHIYVAKNINQKLEPGDQLLIKGKPIPVSPPLNPEQFDYRNYLARQNIHHQFFIAEKNFVITGNELFFLDRWAQNIRQYAMEQFSNIEDPAARGVIQGLVLGSKDNIDDKTKNAYTAAGLMHILAVSGLHVGIIYGILVLLFGYLRRFKAGKYYFALVCLLVLWLYALVTGLSPSVVRASVMFSFFAVAETSRRQKNSYNILSASAFIMLVVDPNLLFTVSFQLSYLAVLGIIYMQPMFEKMVFINNLFLKRMWQLFTVGLAAQIATLPITIFYFQQIPLLSTLIGVLAVPLATASFTLGLVYLAFASIPVISTGLLWLLQKSVQMLNWLANSIERLDFSLLQNIYIDQVQVVVLYGVIFSFLIFLHFKRFTQVLVVFILLMLFSSYTSVQIISNHRIKNLVVFSVPGEQVSQVNLYGKGYLISKKVQLSDKSFEYNVSAYNLKHNIQLQKRMLLAQSHLSGYYSIYNIEGKKIVLLQKLPEHRFAKPLQVDYLVIGNNAVKNLTHLEHYFLAREIILDSSNDDWMVKKLVNEATEKKVSLHPVNTSGAGIIEL